MDTNIVKEKTIQDISNISVKAYKKILIERKPYIIAKRIIDIIGAVLGIIILIPLSILIGFAKIFNKEKSPMFYIHNRIGQDGKLFKMYKFRSMVLGADEILSKYLEENEEAKKEYKKNKKLKNDPRITKIGKFIRETSLDEFPQFINVIKGDMSLVGPRPYLQKEKEEMGEYYPYIIKLKPGITGLWQVSGRNKLTFEKRLELDKEYFEKRSMKMDLLILFKTISKVFDKEGAA